MADVTYTANSGFYDSVNQDRLYGADDMNRPYHRLVSNGIFGTPQGTLTDDLRVVASSGMEVIVKAGEGIFGYKWFELPADQAVTITENSGILPRLDSIIVRVDTTMETRAASIVYREGTPASIPAPPALDTSTGIYEYRLANISVAAGASVITGADISDTRADTSQCGVVTALIYQPDTQFLFEQWKTAYQQYFQSMTDAFNSYASIQQQAWEDFFEEAQSNLTATNNVVKLQATDSLVNVVSEAAGGDIIILRVSNLIPSFNVSTDALNIYINGLKLDETMYSMPAMPYADTVKLDCFTSFPTAANGKITLEVLKSVVPSGLSSIESTLQELNENLSEATADTDWQPLTLASNVYAFQGTTPAYRRIGKQVFISGAVFNVGYPRVVAYLPQTCCPPQKIRFLAGVATPQDMKGTCIISIDTSGNISVETTSFVGSAYSEFFTLDFNFAV